MNRNAQMHANNTSWRDPWSQRPRKHTNSGEILHNTASMITSCASNITISSASWASLVVPVNCWLHLASQTWPWYLSESRVRHWSHWREQVLHLNARRPTRPAHWCRRVTSPANGERVHLYFHRWRFVLWNADVNSAQKVQCEFENASTCVDRHKWVLFWNWIWTSNCVYSFEKDVNGDTYFWFDYISCFSLCLANRVQCSTRCLLRN